jgi:hypothetical protein
VRPVHRSDTRVPVQADPLQVGVQVEHRGECSDPLARPFQLCDRRQVPPFRGVVLFVSQIRSMPAPADLLIRLEELVAGDSHRQPLDVTVADAASTVDVASFGARVRS